MEDVSVRKPKLFVNTKKHKDRGNGYFFCRNCNLPHIYSGISPSCEYYKFYEEVRKSKNIYDFKL